MTSYAGVARLSAAAAIFVCALGFGWCQKHYGTFDWWSGRRICGAPPSEIAVWSYNRHTRRPEEAANLKKKLSRNSNQITTQYGAACETPLHIAAKFGREDLAELLIAAGADVEAVDGYGNKPLHMAAFAGRPTVIKLLLRRAFVDARGRDGKTPLHAAVDGLLPTTDVDAHLEAARLLIAAGADVNARTRSGGFTPLRLATGWERPGGNAMAELLLSNGAGAGR